MSMVIPTKHGIWPRVRAITARVVETQRTQIALWERVYAWPPNEGQLQWVETINGPVLRGDVLPDPRNALR
jgi:hypothetical protein